MLTLEQFAELSAIISAMADVYLVGRDTYSVFLRAAAQRPTTSITARCYNKYIPPIAIAKSKQSRSGSSAVGIGSLQREPASLVVNAFAAYYRT
jgi:hypothetical protein